jgi:hypothetical protein
MAFRCTAKRGVGPGWEHAYQLPGSRQVGLGKLLLSRYSWWKLQPRPELIEPHWSAGDYRRPFSAHIFGRCGAGVLTTAWKALTFSGLDPGGRCRALLFNRSDGSEVPWGRLEADRLCFTSGP